MPAQFDDTFLGTIERILIDSLLAERSQKYGIGRVWSRPPVDKSKWDGDLFNAEGMDVAFNRVDIDVQYFEALDKATLEPDDENRGTESDLMACRVMSDFLSKRERAFRARHCTPVMAACHAASRRKGHSSTTGVWGCAVDYVSNILNDGRF